MGRWLVAMAGLLMACAAVVAQEVSNGQVTVAAAGQPGNFTGLALRSADGDLATVKLSSNGLMIAQRATVTGTTLRLSGLNCDPTPLLGPRSYVEVELLPDSPYPEVRFALDIRAFDPVAWEKRVGTVPFHFLVCSLPGAEVFHQRGWAIGTPVVDQYIQMQAEGPGKTIVSDWSRDWMYAPPIGAYPTAIAGLWNPSQRRYVGYDFHGARLTDHTEKDFGTTYCWQQGDDREFFCLTWPFGKGYNGLRYPETPVRCGTHFRLLWSRDMGPDDDPNQFVQQFIWDTYGELLPDVERMNDLSWLPANYRPTGFGKPGPMGNTVSNTGPDGQRWWQPNVHIAGGVSYFSPVDYYYDSGDSASQARLGRECRQLIGLGKWMDVAGDRCFFWQTPLDGGGAAMFGPGVETFRHVSGWGAGLALLDYCRNEPEGAADVLPYVDGVLRWTKHILYTRNCYPDVPAAQFAWSATPGVTFCLKYYYAYRDDPQRRELAQLAYKLARSLTYRYLAIWPCDNNEMDDLDSSFFMEPNAGLPWLGCACANEIWVYNIAMLYEYVATGDPIMGHYLRGMLERYHELFRDQYYPSVQEYGGAFTERLGLYKECAQGVGSRATFGGLWGGFEQLIWPLGSARVRVVCGERAAMAFNRDGRHTDIADYRYGGDGSCSFRLVPGGLQADAATPMDVTVTFPFFRLAGKAVSIERDGQSERLPPERITTYASEPSTITLHGLRLGDTVHLGDAAGEAPVLSCAIAKLRALPGEEESFVARGDFRLLNLSRGAFAGISRDWNDIGSYAGYEPGLKSYYGVPFLLLDPELTGGPVRVPRQGIAYGEKPHHLFLLLGRVSEGSRVVLYRNDGTAERVDATAAVPATRGWPPVLEWHLDLLAIENGGKPIASIAPVGCDIFAVTSLDRPTPNLPAILQTLNARRAEVIAHREAVKGLAELAPLFEANSGRIAILPFPGTGNPRVNPVVGMLKEAGLGKHLRFLSAHDLINPKVFNAREAPIALYVGGEAYYQTVSRSGDGDEALIRWLRNGGTLVSLADGPFPFYYNEADKPVVSAPRFGLPISGSGIEERLDTLDVAPVTGWEKPPAGLRLTFEVDQKQEVLEGLPARIPWDPEADQRWRPIFNVVSGQDTYTPLVTLRDQEGRSYGEGAAMIEYHAGDLAGARVVYVWSSLRRSREHQRSILTSLLRYLLTHTQRPLGEYVCPRVSAPPVIDGAVDDTVWRSAPPTEVFTRFDAEAADAALLRTTARLAWDDGYLYVAFECEDPDVWSDLTDRDANLWEGEVVEVYVDPDGDGEQYFEFEVNPRNAVIDLRIPRSVQGAPQDVEAARQWDAVGLRSAVRVEGTLDDRDDRDRGWSAELAVPFATLADSASARPRLGDVWRMQLFRIDRSKSLTHPQFLAWSATDAFHNPTRFGRLSFAGNPYADDFSAYANGSTPGGHWAAGSGDWRVVDGALVGTNSGGDGWAPSGICFGRPDWTDYRLRLRFQVRQRGGDHRDGPWIGVRYADATHCYSLNLGSVAQLVKVSGAVSSNDTSCLAQAPWANDTAWHDLAVTVRGSRVAVELDGQPLLSATDDNYLGVGPLRSGGICLSARKWTGSPGDTLVAFDDVLVERLD